MDKLKPIGICDHCGGTIPPPQWYTSKRKPRLYCSIDCRNTANSRAGEPVRHAKLMDRIASGLWRNPVAIRPLTSEEQSQIAHKARLREVQSGAWRNPALTDAARAKLSRPRKHSGTLASAVHKLDTGSKMADLTPGEADVYRAYRRDLARRKTE